MVPRRIRNDVAPDALSIRIAFAHHGYRGRRFLPNQRTRSVYHSSWCFHGLAASFDHRPTSPAPELIRRHCHPGLARQRSAADHDEPVGTHEDAAGSEGRSASWEWAATAKTARCGGLRSASVTRTGPKRRQRHRALSIGRYGHSVVSCSSGRVAGDRQPQALTAASTSRKRFATWPDSGRRDPGPGVVSARFMWISVIDRLLTPA